MDTKRANYQIRPEYPTPMKAKFQVAAIEGRNGLSSKDKHNYYNAAHFDLIKQLVPIRTAFRCKKNLESTQRELAQKELEHWLTYLERRKETVSQISEYWIEDGSVRLLKESFDRMRNRDSQKVDAADLIEVHGLFSKSFTFKVPIHPKNLS